MLVYTTRERLPPTHGSIHPYGRCTWYFFLESPRGTYIFSEMRKFGGGVCASQSYGTGCRKWTHLSTQKVDKKSVKISSNFLCAITTICFNLTNKKIFLVEIFSGVGVLAKVRKKVPEVNVKGGLCSPQGPMLCGPNAIKPRVDPTNAIILSILYKYWGEILFLGDFGHVFGNSCTQGHLSTWKSSQNMHEKRTKRTKNDLQT
jgi:hypothetical protein